MRRVALVMPVRNEEAAVDETMAAILASTRLPDEVVIGDGGSTDRTVAKCLEWRARGLDVKVVDNPALFPGAGRNAAARATECEILLFCDFGNHVDPRWVERMLAPFEADPAAEFVVGMYYPLVKSDFEQCVACVNYPVMVAVQRMTEAERRAFVTADANAGVELPPSIAASKTYRCGDNAIVHVDWMSDNKTANVRVGEGPATILTAAEPGQPMTGGAGFSLTGTASEPSISLTTPDRGKQIRDRPEFGLLPAGGWYRLCRPGTVRYNARG